MSSAGLRLAKRLLSRLTPSQRSSVEEPAELEQRLAAALDEAHGEWPGVNLAPEAFIDHVAARVPAENDVLPALDRLRLADLYLACACARGEPRAIELFEQQLLPGLDPALRRLRLPPATLEDVKQQLRAELLVAGVSGAEPGIARYAGSGRLASWLRVIAVRTAGHLGRKAGRTVLEEEAALERAVHAPQDAELEHLKKVYRREFKAAFREGLAALSKREQTLLRLAHVDGLTVDKIAALYSAPRSTAARWVAKARGELVAHTRAALREKLHASPEECASIMRLIESQIDVTLPTFFRGKRSPK